MGDDRKATHVDQDPTRNPVHVTPVSFGDRRRGKAAAKGLYTTLENQPGFLLNRLVSNI